MKIYLLTKIIFCVFLISIVSAFTNSINTNIQITDSLGNIQTGSFLINFTISPFLNCSNPVYSVQQSLTTDSRGIINYTLDNVNVDFSSTNYTICYYRDGTLKSSKYIGAVPYSFYSSKSNTSNYFDGYNITEYRNFIKLFFDSIYCKLTGCTINGNITADYFIGNGSLLTDIPTPDLSEYANYQFLNNNFNGSGNFTTTGNISAEYIYGQPITGSIGSGIIWANGTNSYAEINVSCIGLTCSYNAFKVRLVNTSNYEKYCDIPSGYHLFTDNQHSVLYVDNNCQIQETSIQNYIETSLSPGGIVDFINVIAEDGTTYNPNGLSIENKRMIKLRKLLLETMHLDILGGFNLQKNTFPQFNITNGSYVYLMDVVDTSKQVTGTNNIEAIYHTSSSTWETSESTGLNFTNCDTGTGIATCTNANLYRRVFIFNIGYQDGSDTTKLHQLLPSQSVSYNTPEECLNTIKYPLTYTLPSFYQYGGVMLYAYCVRPSDTSWTDNIIDLRTVKQSTATGGVDISVFVPYNGATSNVNLSNYNLSTNYLSVNGNITLNTNSCIGNGVANICWI